MRIAKKLTILAFLAGAGSLLASCGDNAQTCGPGTEPNEDGVCLPNGGPDAEPGPDSGDPDAEVDPDADTSPTVSGTIAVFDTNLTDPSAAGLVSVRGPAVRISFEDLTDPEKGGMTVFSGGAGAPIGSCLITQYDATHLPRERLDAGAITLSGSGLLKAVGPCNLQPTLGEPDPYRCISNSSPVAGATVAATMASATGGVIMTIVSPAQTSGFTMSAPVNIGGAARGPVSSLPPNVVSVTTTAAHGFKSGQFVTITGAGTFNGSFPISVTGANTFVYQQAGAMEVVGAAGTASQAGNELAGSSLIVNGFTSGPNAPRFNSGASAFPILAQVNSNSLLVIDSAAAGLPVTGTPATLGAAVQFAVINGASPVPSTSSALDPTLNFLGGAVAPATADLRIQKAAVAGVWGAIDFTADVPGEAPAPQTITTLVRAGGVVTATMPAGHGVNVGQRVKIIGSVPTTDTITAVTRVDANNVLVTTTNDHDLVAGDTVTIAGVTDATFNGTFTVTTVGNPTAKNFTYLQTAANVSSVGGTTTLHTFNSNPSAASIDGQSFLVTGATATTFTYANAGNDATATVAGMVQKSGFALDTPVGMESQKPHVFPTSTAAALNYSCDNNTAGDATDDTCGDESTSTLKALILSGSATRKSVDGLFPFQMPTEVVGVDAWLEWQCAFLVSKSADMPTAAVQAIIDFKPTRIEQQVLFVSGTLLDDGVNVGGLKVLTGHALAGHQTFCPNAGAGQAATGFGPVCPVCSNGIDDDGDNMIDTADSGCTGPGDTAE